MVAKNILVVEDDEDILELVKYNLAKNGYQGFYISVEYSAFQSEEEQRGENNGCAV